MAPFFMGVKPMTYTYDPEQINVRGKDKMRFELGDTYVDGGAMTSALADEEYESILYALKPDRKAWLYAKLYVLEAIMFKLQYQVDTKIDPLTYALGQRAKLWQDLYDKIRKQILASTGIPTMDAKAMNKPYYFYTDMQINIRKLPNYNPYQPFRKMVT